MRKLCTHFWTWWFFTFQCLHAQCYISVDGNLNRPSVMIHFVTRYHIFLADYRDRAFSRPERIRSDSATLDSTSFETAKLQCGVCQKLLRRKPYLLSGSHSTSENSVVAVLVCGHVYHADCLEQKTTLEDKSDPLCPICLNLLSPADAFKGGGSQWLYRLFLAKKTRCLCWAC